MDNKMSNDNLEIFSKAEIEFNQKKENKHKGNFVEIYDIGSENIKYAKKLIEKMSSLAEDIIYKEEIEKSISIFNGIDFELNDGFTEKDFENKTVKVINNDFETFMEEIYILDLETLEVLKKEEQESKGNKQR